MTEQERLMAMSNAADAQGSRAWSEAIHQHDMMNNPHQVRGNFGPLPRGWIGGVGVPHESGGRFGAAHLPQMVAGNFQKAGESGMQKAADNHKQAADKLKAAAVDHKQAALDTKAAGKELKGSTQTFGKASDDLKASAKRHTDAAAKLNAAGDTLQAAAAALGGGIAGIPGMVAKAAADAQALK